jgi:hypothetical protein
MATWGCMCVGKEDKEEGDAKAEEGGGGGINARIGTRTSDEHKQVHRPYDIAQSNSRGENLVHILAAKIYESKTHFPITHKRTSSLTPVFTPHFPQRHSNHVRHLHVLAIPSQAST